MERRAGHKSKHIQLSRYAAILPRNLKLILGRGPSNVSNKLREEIIQ